MARVPWTAADRAMLQEWYEQGDSAGSIAERLGRSTGSVRAQICALGLRRGVGQGYKRPWTGSELERLQELYEGGTPVAEIARQLERGEHAITTQASEQGYKRLETQPPAPPVRRTRRRRATERERELLLECVITFRRLYKLAQEQGLASSKAALFGPFLSMYQGELRRAGRR